MDYKTTGIRYLVQQGGKNLSWSVESGVSLIEQDGLFFKDLAAVERHREDVAFDLEHYVDDFGNRYDYGFGLNGF